MNQTGCRVAVWLLALVAAGWSIGAIALAQYGPPQPYQGPPPGAYAPAPYPMPPGGQPPVFMGPPGSGPPQGFYGQPGGGPPGFMGPGGGPPGEGRQWGRGRGGSPEERAARIEGFLRRFDKNNDGRIDNSELNDQERMFLEGMAQRSGMKVEYPVSIDEVKKTLSQRGGRGRDGGGPQGGGPPGQGQPGGAPAAPPKVAGFGVQAKPAPVAGFGPAANAKPAVAPGAARAAAPAPAANAGSPSPSPNPEQSDAARGEGRIRRLAESNMRRFDKNKNGQLDRDEWAHMQARFGPADGNGDGAITLDEMSGWLGAYGGGQGNRQEQAGVEVASAASPGGQGGRKSYRFRSAAERLPEGLPPWFAQRDANADGQVSMAEYASLWSDSVVSEFAQFDLNGDGIITPRECLRGH